MNGKIIGIFFLASALIGAAAVYYLQVYAFYEEVDASGVEIRLTRASTGAPEVIDAQGLQVIDASSSPLRFRACFTIAQDQAALTETFVAYDGAEPLTGPGWFGCYDAAQVGAALVAGDAVAYLSEKNIEKGVDRVVAIMPDGRGFAWHQLNEIFAD